LIGIKFKVFNLFPSVTGSASRSGKAAAVVDVVAPAATATFEENKNHFALPGQEILIIRSTD